MKRKDIAIDVMKELLEIGRKLPFFHVLYCISAKNEDIEEWVKSLVDHYDWDGRRFSDATVKVNEDAAVERFHNSKGYNPNGKSKIMVSQCFTLSSISYADVYETVSGKRECLPKGYKFEGDVQQTDVWELWR